MEAATTTIETPKRRRRLRKMTWALIVWTVLMLAWAIGGAANVTSDASVAECDRSSEYLNATDCEALSEVGAGIGVTLILGAWFAGFIVLSLVWFMSRPREAR